MRAMTRSLKYALWNWEESLAVIALIVMTSSVSFGVVSRYVTVTSATWAVELANLSFTWVVFLGAAAAFRRGLHVSVDMIVRPLPARAKALVAWVVDLLLLGFLSYVLYLSVLITIESGIRPSPVLRIPFSYVYAALVLSLGSMLIQHLRHLVLRVRKPWELQS
jgi:TRAP-type C4-dicarboxylate transport system permease small subunit